MISPNSYPSIKPLAIIKSVFFCCWPLRSKSFGVVFLYGYTFFFFWMTGIWYSSYSAFNRDAAYYTSTKDLFLLFCMLRFVSIPWIDPICFSSLAMSEDDMGCGTGGKLFRNWVDCWKALLAELNCLTWSTLLLGNDTSLSAPSFRGTSILRRLKFLSYFGFTSALIMILLLLFFSIVNEKKG